MGWQTPEFAHLSLILKPEGKGKLEQKRQCKNLVSVFPNFYDAATGKKRTKVTRRSYFVKLFVNFLALLGWSPSDDKEI